MENIMNTISQFHITKAAAIALLFAYSAILSQYTRFTHKASFEPDIPAFPFMPYFPATLLISFVSGLIPILCDPNQTAATGLAILFSTSGILAATDWKIHYAPENITTPLLLIGLAYSPIANAEHRISGMVVTTLVMIGFLAAGNGQINRKFSIENLSQGDIAYAAALGAWLGDGYPLICCGTLAFIGLTLTSVTMKYFKKNTSDGYPVIPGAHIGIIAGYIFTLIYPAYF